MAWHDGLPDAGLDVECHGRAHRVRWHRGHLQLLDHPELGSEAVLAALGGDPPPCLQVLDLWRAAVADGGFLAEWARREDADPGRRNRMLGALARLHREGVQDVLPELEVARAARMAVVLACFPHDLVDRAALAVAQRVLRQPAFAEHELTPWLAQAVRVRARSAFVRSLAGWGHRARPAALVRFACRVGVGVTPTVTGRLDGSASWSEVVLDLDWLLRVWGQGLAVVDGRLVLDAVPTAGHADGAARSLLVLDWRPNRAGIPTAHAMWRPRPATGL
jgi:hypothetical protein